jgi:signal transduction histidine kinase
LEKLTNDLAGVEARHVARAHHLAKRAHAVDGVEDGALVPEIMRVDAREVVAGVINELKDIYDKKSMSCELDPPVDPVMVHTDQALLGIVVHNLLTNAAKYSQDKTHVDVILREEGAEWTLTVRDQGFGIPDREQAHLFQKFFRAKNVRTIDTDGSGLGLYIMKLIVESLGGTISFRSHEGQGTTFVVRLPVQPEIAPAPVKKDDGTARA